MIWTLAKKDLRLLLRDRRAVVILLAMPFIFILILVAWVTKIFLHAPMAMNSVPAFYRALRVGHIPSWLVAFVFVGTFISVIGITIYVSKKSSGEISEFGTHRSLWRL